MLPNKGEEQESNQGRHPPHVISGGPSQTSEVSMDFRANLLGRGLICGPL